jgi:hypothetical protein
MINREDDLTPPHFGLSLVRPTLLALVLVALAVSDLPGAVFDRLANQLPLAETLLTRLDPARVSSIVLAAVAIVMLGAVAISACLFGEANAPLTGGRNGRLTLPPAGADGEFKPRA